ncbi:MAG: tetratricopeptide repeat protein, partial [Candidatus Omnitrophica bacterium]|nr:tetratricopeptide repeat protein [Candidatus Omnitrophota bacterium]
MRRSGHLERIVRNHERGSGGLVMSGYSRGPRACVWVIIFMLTGPVPGLTTEAIGRQRSESVEARREIEKFDFANGLFARNMYEMAVEAYKDFLNEYPKSDLSGSARYRMAEAYYAADRYQEALNSYTAFLDRHPSSDRAGQALLGVGQCYYFLKDLKNAEKVLNKLLSRRQSGQVADGAMYYLSSVFTQRGELERARGTLR